MAIFRMSLHDRISVVDCIPVPGPLLPHTSLCHKHLGSCGYTELVETLMGIIMTRKVETTDASVLRWGASHKWKFVNGEWGPELPL